MKISFPYMGQVTVFTKIFEMLGHEVIVPPKPTQKTFELGVKYSPEFLCYPFKAMMGTYFEAVEMGAEAIVSSGGTGPCRAGYYGELHEKILKQQGHDVPVIIFDSIFQKFGEFRRQLKLVLNGTSVFKLLHILKFGYKMLKHMDELEAELRIQRAYEIKQGSFDKAWEEIKTMFLNCKKLKDLKTARKQAEEMFAAIPKKEIAESEKKRVGLIGEIYVLMESSTNMEIERRLNAMGVEVYNVQCYTHWLRHNVIPRIFNREYSYEVIKKSDKYSKVNCGGHDKENIGWIVDFAERGFDAVVHLMPFSCLPELVTRSVIPAVSEDLNIPILSVSLDEQTGVANMQTRLEAFIDLVLNKRSVAEKFEYTAKAALGAKSVEEVA